MLAFLRTLLAVIVGFFLTIFLIILFLAILASGSKDTVVVKNNSVLMLDLNKPIPERPYDNPLEDIPFIADELDFPVSLKEIVDNIRYAKTDDNIKGIYMETGFIQGGLPTIEAIRNALIDFKTSGKFVYAYSEMYTQRNYYLASVADSIFLNPNGLIDFAGFHSEQLYLKGLFAKLDITPHLIRAGKYKSAGEMFIRDSMSKENREQLEAYINSSYDYFLARIDSARHIPATELRDIANKLKVRTPHDAVKHKLIDRLAYKDEMLELLKKKTGAAKIADINKIEMDKYGKSVHPMKKSGRERIALIYAVGDINGGKGDEESIGSDKLSQAIREAREDDEIKAIVLRVNSPGGSALASDVIWREVLLAKQKKPVIASFGDLAASGGYYIAAPADYIFSEPNCITGSIGVFGLLPDMQAFWKNKLGITWDRVKTGPYADLGNPNRPLTKEEEAIIQSYIDTTYEQFKDRVASGRKLDRVFVDSIAQGRIYSGLQGKKLGLVDEIGNLNDAIRMAAKKGGIEGKDYGIEILPDYKSGFLSSFNRSVSLRESILQEELGTDYDVYKKAKSLKEMSGVLMYFPYDIVVE